MNKNSQSYPKENGSFEPRFYRERMGVGRFSSFIVGYKDSDLWIGIDPASYNEIIPKFAQQKLIELRQQLEGYILINPEFETSFSPININVAPEIAIQMSHAGTIAKTGPMAAVAGAFSEYIGKAIQNKFNIKEIVVENGGDIYLSLQQPLVLSIYAGSSPLSEKIGIEIPAGSTPLGICTSAGTVGHSTSFGKADAVVVACKNTALADAFATAIGNRIKNASNIENELQIVDAEKKILSVLIICEKQIGIKGDFELKLLK